MRPKFVFALIFSSLLILSAALFLKQHLGSRPVPPDAAEVAPPAPAAASSVVTRVALPTTPISSTPAVTSTPTPEQRQAAIDTETDRLQQLSVNDDPASLSAIEIDLINPEKEIRDAAIEAAKQFGSKDAIPSLKDAAASTTDPEEKAALLEAADFLSLPSITDSSVQLPRTPEQIQADQQKILARQNLHNQLHPRPTAQSAPAQNPPTAPNN